MYFLHTIIHHSTNDDSINNNILSSILTVNTVTINGNYTIKLL